MGMKNGMGTAAVRSLREDEQNMVGLVGRQLNRCSAKGAVHFTLQ